MKWGACKEIRWEHARCSLVELPSLEPEARGEKHFRAFMLQSVVVMLKSLIEVPKLKTLALPSLVVQQEGRINCVVTPHSACRATPLVLLLRASSELLHCDASPRFREQGEEVCLLSAFCYLLPTVFWQLADACRLLYHF
jgi:hypothetical protein